MPQIYQIEEHKIKKQAIDSEALFVLEQLRLHGFSAYLVGGSVRDLLLGYTPKDFDISTSATPQEIKRVFRNCILIGRRFLLAHVRFGKKIIEVSTFRSGDNEANALITHDNKWGSPEEDVLRRDFSVNGLFYDAQQEVIVDYVHGYEDIQNRYLRTIGDPNLRFKQDPVRMLRLLKLLARFDFTVDQATEEALQSCRLELSKSSSDRILEELIRMLGSGYATRFWRLLSKWGFVELLIPELHNFLGKNKDSTLPTLLQNIDALIKTESCATQIRPLLLAAIVFPMFENKILQEKKNRKIHLGEIYEQAHKQTEQLFSSFFRLSKRLQSSVSAILMNQYRLVPLDQRLPKQRKIPKDPDLLLSLCFLELRAKAAPDLRPFLESWQEQIHHPSMLVSHEPRLRRNR